MWRDLSSNPSRAPRRVRFGVCATFALGLWAAGCAESDNGLFVPDDAGGGGDVAVKGDGGDAGPIPSFDVMVRDASDASLDGGEVAVVCDPSETCGNGLDDNCNGSVDEGCACVPMSTQRCFVGPPRAAGIGACEYGMQRCEGAGQEFGVWGACAGSRGPSGELCDGVDNNCNGVVDDGCACRAGDMRGCYGGPPSTRTIGACRDGAQTCVSGAGGVGSSWGDCAGDTRPGTEVCDGVDNDCNGTVDDGCACRPDEARRCYGGPAGTDGVGRCHAGMQTCAAASGGAPMWGACAGQELPTPELCDGVDNDCNGTIDDGCACRPDESRACYSGPLGTRGVGLCAPGMQRCVAGPGGVGSSWGVCTGERLPATESCDDLDNNCDGAVDEVCACRRGDMRSCYTGAAGTAGVGACRAGMQACAVASGVASWGACAGQVVPAAEACDGVDNDCNGVVDDRCLCRLGATQGCYAGAMATAGVGLCRAGTQTCVAGAGGAGSAWGTCTGQTLPATELCDGLDNDCNGVIDDGCACRLGAMQGCYTGAAGTSGVGVCRAGSQTCVAGAGGVGSVWGACGGQTLPATELCDGLDNNCNGVIDDGCACRASEMRGCYTGPAGTSGVGVCRAGSQTCAITGGVAAWGGCTGETLPGVEACNMIDDDCDGMIDEGCTCTAGASRSCYGGPAGTSGVGVCRAGSQTCVAGAGGVGSAWGACTGQTLPVTEVCDGVDNDCNGTVDEGCACRPGATQGCYMGPTGTAGVGVCRAGSQTCVAGAGGVGSAWGACTGQTLPSAELCDSADNNCDGVVDDGCACRVGATQGCYTGPTGTSGVGVCRSGSQTCAAGAGGVGSAWGACTGQTLPTSETCNMADDNCDGMVDNGVSCAGPTVRCPAPITGPAGDVVVLLGSATGAVSYRWEVVSTPAGGSAILGSPTSLNTAFLAEIVGTYTVRFTATDAAGRTSSCETTVTMLAHGLRVELNWDTGIRTADPASTLRTDLDLHVHNRTAPAWFNDPDDCYYNNRTPRWDVRGSTADDPSLDIDNVYGFGPENTSVDAPVPTAQTYSVGVHYFYGAARSNATVRIYCGARLIATYTRALNGGAILGASNDFWRVARVTFSDASNCAVTPVNDVIPFSSARVGSP